MLILLAEVLNKNCKIDTFLVYLLLIVNIKNFFMVSKLILKINILNFWLLIIVFILFFTMSKMYFIANVLNMLSFVNIFWILDKFDDFINK